MRRFSFGSLARIAPLALLTAALGTAALVTTTDGRATPVAPTAARIERATRVGAVHPWLQTGELAAPSARPAIAVARDVLARHAPYAASLETPYLETIALSDGASVVAFNQTIGGVPVLQRGARVIVEKDGRATTLNASLEERAPRTLTPTLTESGAVAAAAKLGVPANELGARLMILPTGSEPALVYGVVGDLGALPTRPVVLLDAHTGEVVTRWDAAKTLKKAKVFQDNPVKTPTTTEVTLDNDASKPGLENSFVKGFNCIDKKTVRDVNFGIPLKVHTCDLLQTIVPDAAGDYLDIVPELTSREDKYAELSMFYHTDRAYLFVKGLGFPDSKVIQLNAVANLRVPQGLNSYDTKKMADPELPLAPFDNAFFAEKDPLLSTAFGLEGDAMWFGQGTMADFGYDGDVVYHEFGHFLVSRTIKLGGGTWQDAYGLSYSPGGLNESIADILSFMITNDPELGEYTTTGLGYPKGKGLRSATNGFVFPQAITGEVHQDGEPQNAAVWSVYSALDAAKKASFHKAFLETLLTATPGNLGYADFAELLIKRVESKVDAATGGALRKAYEDRGIKADEPRVIPYVEGGVNSVVSQLGFHAPGTGDMTTKSPAFAPNIFQIGYDVQAGGTNKLTVAFKMLQRGGAFGSGTGGLGGSSGTPFTPKVIARLTDPVKFAYSPFAAEFTVEGACTVAADKKSGTCDLEVPVEGTWGTTQKLNIMVVNTGKNGADLDNFVVTTTEAPPEPPAPPAPAATTTTTTTSCGCTTPGSSSNGAAATFALAALGLALATRRRR